MYIALGKQPYNIPNKKVIKDLKSTWYSFSVNHFKRTTIPKVIPAVTGGSYEYCVAKKILLGINPIKEINFFPILVIFIAYDIINKYTNK